MYFRARYFIYRVGMDGAYMVRLAPFLRPVEGWEDFYGEMTPKCHAVASGKELFTI